MLPQVMATGNIQSGTIDRRKLSRVIPTQTPTGWRFVSQSTLVGQMSLEHWPIIQARDAAGELDHLDCGGIVARGSASRLAVLAGVTSVRQLLGPRMRVARGSGNITRGPLHDRLVSAQAGSASARPTFAARSISSVVQVRHLGRSRFAGRRVVAHRRRDRSRSGSRALRR